MNELIDVKEHPLLIAYREHRKAFTHWSVLYGVGAPVFFVTKLNTAQYFKNNPDEQICLLYFLIAAMIQVSSSLIYKNIIWFMYLGETENLSKNSIFYKVNNYLYRKLWVEWLFDLPTILLLSFSTYKILIGVLQGGT